MLTIKKKIYLIMKVMKEDVLYIFYILLTLIFKVKIQEAEETVKAATNCIKSFFIKIRNVLILEIAYTQDTFINKAENKILLYSNLLAPPLIVL